MQTALALISGWFLGAVSLLSLGLYLNRRSLAKHGATDEADIERQWNDLIVQIRALPSTIAAGDGEYLVSIAELSGEHKELLAIPHHNEGQLLVKDTRANAA